MLQNYAIWELIVLFLINQIAGNTNDLKVNHMEGKITEVWLANEEGIFS